MISQTGRGPTPEFGAKGYYQARFLPKTDKMKEFGPPIRGQGTFVFWSKIFLDLIYLVAHRANLTGLKAVFFPKFWEFKL